MLPLLAVLLVSLSTFVLGLIVLLKNRGNFTNTSFGIFTFMLSVWIIVEYFSNDLRLSYGAQLWLNRITVFMPGLGLYFLLLFSLEFTRLWYKYFRPFAIICGLITLAISALSTTSLLIKDIVPRGQVIAVKFGAFSPLFSIYIISLFVAVIAIFYISLHRLSGIARARTQIMTLSLFTALSITVVTNLILPVGFSNYDYIQIGLLSVIILVGGFAYAIVKQRLFDIRAVVARSIAYLLLLCTLIVTYAFMTFKIGSLLFKTSSIPAAQQTYNIIIAMLLAITFHPLQRFFEKITNKLFYRGRYDPQRLLHEITQVLASEIELVKLSHKVRKLLTQYMQVSAANIVVLHNGKVLAEGGNYVVSQLEELADELDQIKSRFVVTDELPEGQRKETMVKYGLSILATLRVQHEEKAGYLLLGSKLNGDIFTNEDLRIIKIIAGQLAIAIQNAKAYLEIKRFNKTLQTKISDATKQLRDANHSLQQLDQIKDEFISIASHQLRTPITVVEGYLANMADGVYGEFNTSQKQAIRLTQNRLKMMEMLVADMLNVSRIESGRFFIDRGPFDLNKVVPEEIEHLKLRANELEVQLIYKAPPQPVPVIIADEQKVRQVIVNLIDNALNYSPKGRVVVALDAAAEHVTFTVTDNGIGVSKADQAKLFTKFFRTEKAKQTRLEGTGLGLYLVKQVIDAHKGAIIFSSQEGRGSTFGFSLSVNQAVENKPSGRQLAGRAPSL